MIPPPAMDTLTHALAPVIIARLCLPRTKWTGRTGLITLGLAGALPDLLNPHLTLEARTSSWSHGLPFWLTLSACLLIAALLSRRRFPVAWALALSAAYLLHLVCDAISGGVNWLYPLRDFTLGAYWVDPVLWVPLDILCLLLCYYLFRLRPLWQKRRRPTCDAGPSP